MNDTTLQNFTDGLFKDIVGQEKPKRVLKMFLDSYIRLKHIPNTILVAPRGNGKTRMATEIARGLYQFDENGNPIMSVSPVDSSIIKPKRKKFLEVNCSSLGTVNQFLQGFVLQEVVNKDVTVFFDEASEIPHDVSMALLTIIQPNKLKTEYVHKDYVYEFDFTRQTFLFATTETQKMFHALMDRLERVTLQEYTLSELGQILRKALGKDITCDDDVIELASSTVRGNARGSESMAAKMNMYLNGRTHFSSEDWEKFIQIMGIVPFGLNDLEIQVMRHLSHNPKGTPLTNLAAKTGMTQAALQKDVEMMLKKHDLIEVSTTGRLLTGKGLEYLRNLDSKQPVVDTI